MGAVAVKGDWGEVHGVTRCGGVGEGEDLRGRCRFEVRGVGEGAGLGESKG
jgi:hypothetical protein